MKKFTSLFALSFFVSVSLLAQTPMHYNTNSGTSNNTYPFGQTPGHQTQWLIRPNELNQPNPVPPGSNITRLYFFMGGTATVTFTNLKIWLGQTTLTSLPSGQWYPGTLDLVYSRASVQLSSVTVTWMNISLDVPFFYDPSQSLVISVQQCGASASGMNVRQSTGTPTIRNYSSPSACPQSYVGGDGQQINFGIDVIPAFCNFAWGHQASGTTTQLNTVKAVSDMVGWAGGNNATVRKTTNGGITWSDGNSNPGIMQGDINAIEALDANIAFATTARNQATTYVWKTSNSGANWFQMFTQSGTDPIFYDIKFINANTGFVCGKPMGGRWSLFKTTDGGNTWDSAGMYLQQAGSETGFSNTMMILGTTIWFGTNNTRIYRSTNFGATGSWSYGTTTGEQNSYCLHFNSGSNGMMGGATSVLRTTDGGSSWTSVGSIPGSGNITGLEGANNNWWYTRGTGIYITTNNGGNWSQAFTAAGTSADIDFSAILGCPRGWVVGSGGFIDRMDVVLGIGNSNSGVPDRFALEQNFPNPFNPSTIINYQLSMFSYVRLKVYDLLGREVATLLSREMQPGYYSVDFDGTNLSSGLYFYTIQAGDFTDTKKMLLVK
jgi:photosystem II stability/assembly factor-like uncharacterized protein